MIARYPPLAGRFRTRLGSVIFLHRAPTRTPACIRSIAWDINGKVQIVGQSKGGAKGSHAVIWENGIPVDLNSRVSSSLILVYANDIDDSGVIVGGAFNPATGASPGFVAIPVFGLDPTSGDTE